MQGRHRTMRAILLGLLLCTALASRSFADAKADIAAEQVARGKALVDAGDCASCHTADTAKPFAGGKRIDTPFGGIYSPNLTPDRDTGIGGWSDDDFYGAQLTGRIGYHTFEGITLYADEKTRMLESLGDKHVLVLRNHGVAVCESNIPRTFFLLWTVQRAAEIQCLALSMAGDNVALPVTIGQRCADQAQQLIAGSDFADKWFAAMVRRSEARRRAQGLSG